MLVRLTDEAGVISVPFIFQAALQLMFFLELIIIDYNLPGLTTMLLFSNHSIVILLLFCGSSNNFVRSLLLTYNMSPSAKFEGTPFFINLNDSYQNMLKRIKPRTTFRGIPDKRI